MLETVIYNQGTYMFPSLLVLGCFDALHIGHRELLKKAKLQAKINGLDLGVMIFKDGKGGDTVLTLDERIKILESYNVKFILLAEYNEEFKKTTASEFLQVIDEQLNLKGMMSGKDFRFGAGAKGKSSTLKNYADDEDNGVWYMSVKDVTDGGVKVSTTGIKELLLEGDVVKANELLGGCFSVRGKVVHGAGRGGEVIGFPTVNVSYPENKIKIKQGVYKVKSVIGGTEYLGIANYGARPTFGEEDCVLEVNYEGFNGDLYGQEIIVEFIDYIRDIKTFEGAEQLAEQLEKDKLCVENTGIGHPEEAAVLLGEKKEELQEEKTEQSEDKFDDELNENVPEEVCGQTDNFTHNENFENELNEMVETAADKEEENFSAKEDKND